ncbi:MAG TPA: ABC transporter permease subunit [bacterium]|nr:ABC transporter permease subunit [bacterium]
MNERAGTVPRWALTGKALTILLLLAAWEVLPRALHANPLLFPRATTVFSVWLDGLRSGELVIYAGRSLQVLLLGMGVGVAGAFVLAMIALFTRFGRDLLEVMASMFNPLPAIALFPLALLWFGLGINSMIFVLVHATIWPMALSVRTGFVTVPPTLVLVGRNLGFRGWPLAAAIYVPAALPSILTGLRIAWAFAWRTLIAAELVFGVIGGKGGLGWYIYQKRYYLETPAVFAGLATIVLIGLVVEHGIFRAAEERTIKRWGMSA